MYQDYGSINVLDLGRLLTGLEPAHTQPSTPRRGQCHALYRLFLSYAKERDRTREANGQYEYLKYLLVAISATPPQFRHTQNLRTEILLDHSDNAADRTII